MLPKSGLTFRRVGNSKLHVFGCRRKPGQCPDCPAGGRELSPMLVFARAGEQGGVELCVQLDGDLHVKPVRAAHARNLIKQLVEAL